MVTPELEFYASPGRMTDLSPLAERVADLPTAVGELCRIVQGLVIHPFWLETYKVSVPDERQPELQIRPAAEIIEAALQLDGAPLTQARPPDRRVLGNCRDFSTVLTAMLRHQERSARARCGFGTYFVKDYFIDHWVVEWWNGGRWQMTDAQLDDVQRDALKLRFDPLDMPDGRFLDAGRAWQMYRRGEAEGDRFGILDMFGPWFIQGNLDKDLASLNKIELLPWDAWNLEEQSKSIDLYDEVAAITTTADFDAVRSLYERNDRLRVPDVITSFTPSGPQLVHQ